MSKRRGKKNKAAPPAARPAQETPALAPLDWRLTALLIVLTLAAYGPVIQAGFIWDDDLYVTENKTLRDLDGLEHIWFDRRANPQFYPLVHTVFWIEYHLWVLNPLGYHLVNVSLHAANAVLLLLVLRRLNVPGAFWAAGLFAVHPAIVESVAWVTELKNVLSAFFYLCSFWALMRFWPPEREKPQPDGRWRYYVLAFLLFAGALFSKTVACSFPAAFLLVRWWKQGRLTWRDAWVTVPFFALGLLLALNTASLEKDHVGASGKEWDFSLIDRVLIAGRALWFYVGTLVWPSKLTFIYPRWQIDAGTWWQYLFPLAAVGAIGALWALRRRLGRGPLTAALFFAGTLVPALGFFNVYPMRYSFVADHFQYLASVGLLALAGGAVELCRSRWAANLNPSIAAACCLLFAVLAFLTWRQVGVYKDLMTLWNDTLEKNPTCWVAYNNRGALYKAQGKIDLAFADLCKTIEFNPEYGEAYNNRGLIYQQWKCQQEALDDFNRTIQLLPYDWRGYLSRGLLYSEQGELDKAGLDFNRAIALRPEVQKMYSARGMALAEQGVLASAMSYNNRGVTFLQDQWEQAIADFSKAIALKPDYAEAFFNRGQTYAKHERPELALPDLDRAIELKPDFVKAYVDRGSVHGMLGHYDAALQDLARAPLEESFAAACFERAKVHYALYHYKAAWDEVKEGQRLGGQPEAEFLKKLTRASAGMK